MAVCSAPVREAATFTPTSLSSAGMWASPGPPLIVSPGILVKAGAEAGGRGRGVVCGGSARRPPSTPWDGAPAPLRFSITCVS